MTIFNSTILNLDSLKEEIAKGQPLFFVGSKTSTVIPYDRLEAFLKEKKIEDFYLCDLSQMEGGLSLDQGHLRISGAHSWQEAKLYCQSHGQSILTSPTEELANLLSGIATSATGERCFGFGTLRDQVKSLKYMDAKGEIHELREDRELRKHSLFLNNTELLDSYQREYKKYENFKNAPFPRLEKETDLMTGFEGQLGVIVEAEIKTLPQENVTYLFFSLPKWEQDYEPHMELFHRVQAFREDVFACELIDENSLSYLPKEERMREGRDLIFLEIRNESFEKVYHSLIEHLKLIEQEDIFEVPAPQCREFRMKVPRAIFEMNTKMGVNKKGTDVQVNAEDFSKLLDYYKNWTQESSIPFNLFGHFGDAHLHFNFMPQPSEVEKCEGLLEELYWFVKELNGSPFAEHGIGLIKKAFIKPYYSETQKDMFQFLKKNMDPQNIFFPYGFMGDL